jgi:hypothetical protein
VLASKACKPQHIMIGRFRPLLFGLVLGPIMALFGCKEKDRQKETAPGSDKYQVGQEWSYKTRPNESGSTLIITNIDEDSKLTKIISIYVKGLKIKNTLKPGGGVSTEFPHLPLSMQAMDKSVVKIINEKVELPQSSDGYHIWRDAFDKHQAGVFSIPVSECIDAAEAAMSASIKK